MKYFHNFIAILLLPMLLCACSDEQNYDFISTIPRALGCTSSDGKSVQGDLELRFAALAHQPQTFTVKTLNTQWRIEGSGSWIHLSHTSGTKDETVTVTVDDNVSTNVRKVTLSLVSLDMPITRKITVTQDGISGGGTTGGGGTTPTGAQTFTVKGVSFTMMPVAGGTFQMGATKEQLESGLSIGSDETTVHSVTLSNYYIGMTEVTQSLWFAVMGEKPSSSSSYSWSSTYGLGDDYPAYYISYDDCQTFITKLNDLTGKSFRMPTEAEWEYAARGGNKSKGYIFSGSNTIGYVAWYTVNSYDKGSSSPDYGTHKVATLNANELGIYDMSGNVGEWCSDWYGSYSSASQNNPTGPATGASRVFRGGGWNNSATDCRVANRFNIAPGHHYNGLGLRLAL